MLEWLREPGFFGTHATVGADMSQLMATFFTGLFVIGWIQAKRHRADAHHWMMFHHKLHSIVMFHLYQPGRFSSQNMQQARMFPSQ